LSTCEIIRALNLGKYFFLATTLILREKGEIFSTIEKIWLEHSGRFIVPTQTAFLSYGYVINYFNFYAYISGDSQPMFGIDVVLTLWKPTLILICVWRKQTIIRCYHCLHTHLFRLQVIA